MVIWMVIVLMNTLLSTVSSQNDFPTGTCNTALGLESGDISSDNVTSTTPQDDAWFGGRLRNKEGAWCFQNDSIASQNAVLIIDLGERRFWSGIASQGPPEKLHPSNYNQVVAFSAEYSMDQKEWTELNDQGLIFDTYSSNKSDVINYFESSSIILTRYVKINVTMQSSRLETICLRFELYGCNIDVQPTTEMQAITTPKGKIEVKWNTPTADTAVEQDSPPAAGQFKANEYVVNYKPEKAQEWKTVKTEDMSLSLEDVKLGAIYIIQMECRIKNISINCGSTQVEAYPPCPPDWTGGNEYHCFLYMSDVSLFEEAKGNCLEMDADEKLGELSFLVDEEEQKFISERILPDDVSRLWLVGHRCLGNEDCCKMLVRQEDGRLVEAECGEEQLTSAICLKDHKGEGSRIRISSVSASSEGTFVSVTWRYEGIGWKTDELQAKLWTESSGQESPKTLIYSTVHEQVFRIENLEPGTMYSVLLRPAPNIRSEEMTYQFIIIDFSAENGKFGALLMPIQMSAYVIWSGSLKLLWDAAKTYSETGDVRESSKYSISHQMETPNAESKEFIVESGREFQLTPLTIQMKYIFRLGCFFANKFHPCGMVSVRTDSPNHVDQVDGLFTIYEVINNTFLNWLEAEEDCQKRSGHLISILSESEKKPLLKMLPSKDAKLWIGFRFLRNGTRQWTDGNEWIVWSSKSSGVFRDKESCCWAVKGVGELAFQCGECLNKLPHVCKYQFRDIMAPPTSLSIISQKWNSFEVGWKGPDQGWLPTLYKTKVCRKEMASDCLDQDLLSDRRSFEAEDMSEFTEYDVTIQGILEPLALTTSAKINVFTYPKTPLRFTISSNGEMSVATPMLVAMGKPEAKLTATVFREDAVIMTIPGNVKKVTLDKLIPEESYELLVKDQDSDWEQRIPFEAVSACASSDVGVGDICLRLVKTEQGFASAKSKCASSVISEAATDSISLIVPELDKEVQVAIQKLESNSDFWLDYSTQEANDEDCQTKEGSLCSWYGKSQMSIVSSYCCDKMLPFVCTYRVKANLGKVTDLNPSFIGNTSLQVQWTRPPDVKWDIRRYLVEWSSTETENAQQYSQVLEDKTQITLEDLEIGTEYEVTVTPLGMKGMKGDSEKLLVSTLDPRPKLTIAVEPNGVVKVSSDILLAKGRGKEKVDLAVFQIEPETREKRTVWVLEGLAQEVNITSLEPGGEYWIEMTPREGRRFNYSGSFKAYPSCEKGQIQEGLVCVWAAQESKNPREAIEVCRNKQGELLDYETQKELTPSAKALLASYVKTQFWMDLSDTSSALIDGTSRTCASATNTDIMCCTFEVTAEGELDDLKCTCCDEPRPFACKTQARVDLGNIGDITVEDVTSSSLSLIWSMASSTKWQQPSYLVEWESTDENRKKREADNQLVVKDSGITIGDLKPDTSYRVSVTPYTDKTQIGGSPKEITVSTKEEVIAAGLVDVSCTENILKITCCTIVIVGTICTVFVLIATRMFYIDCLAQIFSELAILGAYICILVSSAQSYSIDNECVRSHETLCVAVSALIQFFFQSAFLFLMLESLLLCTALKDYLPTFCAPRSPITLMIIGFGIPAIMNIVLAAIASDEYSDGNDKYGYPICWLYLQGRAMLPSVLPVIISGVLALFLLMSLFDADEPKSTLTPTQALRGRVFLKTRWACFAILALLSVSYSTGMVGANDRKPTLNYIFVGFSIALGVLMPLLRIRCDDQIREQLKRGLFVSMRDDLGGIRVTPAPESYEPNPLLKMAEFDNPKYRKKQLANLTYKNSGESLADSDVVWHR